MFQKLTVSALLVAGLFAMTTVAQPPADPKKQPGDKAKPADPADAAVAAALANDPDVRIARAKMQLAEAEVAKAKQAVVLRVMNLNASIREHKAIVSAAQDRIAHATAMVQRGNAPQSHLLEERAKLETAQAALARIETELKLLTGGSPQAQSIEVLDTMYDLKAGMALDLIAKSIEENKTSTLAAALAALDLKGAVKGPVADRLRAALDKRLKLGEKGEQVAFEKALERFKKETGLDVAVRYGANTGGLDSITSEGEELPIVAWFQLYQDSSGQGFFYVRDYGLLFVNKQMAPPDAPTLTEFWKQKLSPTAKPDEPKK